MSDFLVETATRHDVYLRLLLEGGPKTGKTLTSLKVARALCLAQEQDCESDPTRICFLDTEFRSAMLYALTKSGSGFNFTHLSFGVDPKNPKRILSNAFDPKKYIEAMRYLLEKYEPHVLIIDSLTPAYSSEGGVETINLEAVKTGSYSSYTAWKLGGRAWDELMHNIRITPAHVIATARSKTERIILEGSKKPVEVGLKAEVRPTTSFHFDVIGQLTAEHTLYIEQSRCRALEEIGRWEKPSGEDIVDPLIAWLHGDMPALELEGTADESLLSDRYALSVRMHFEQVMERKPAWCEQQGEDWREKLVRLAFQLKSDQALPDLLNDKQSIYKLQNYVTGWLNRG